MYVFTTTSPSADPEVSLPAVKVIVPPAPLPDAVPPVIFKLPAAAPALLPLSIVTAFPAVVEVVAVGLFSFLAVFAPL